MTIARKGQLMLTNITTDSLLRKDHPYRKINQFLGLAPLVSQFKSLYSERGAPGIPLGPVIGHIKNGGRLGRNCLKGEEGDGINAVLSGCGYNMRKLLARLLFLLCRVWLFICDRASKSGVSGAVILSPV